MMTIAEATLQFSERYYQWARGDGLHEIETNFPLLAPINGRAISKYLRYVRALKPAEQRTFVVAMVKRAHPEGATLSADPISDQERWALENYIDTEDDLKSAEPVMTKSTGRSLWAHLRRELNDCCGTFEQLDDKMGRYVRKHGVWTVVTSVGVLKVPYYRHSVRTEENYLLADGIQLAAWLGISSQTRWASIPPGTEVQVAQHIRVLVDHFLQAVPRLLEGLADDSLKLTDR